MILDSLMSYAKEARLTEIFIEVRRSNDAAINLYVNRGFECVGERKGFYRCPVEDALIMRYTVL